MIFMAAAGFIPTACINIEKESASVLNLSAATVSQTKVSGTVDEDESRLNCITFYVFDEAGDLEASAIWSDESGASCKVMNGTKTVYAVVNCSLSGIPASEEELLSKISYIFDNDTDNLVMSGCTVEEVDGDKNIRIQVRRLAGKVVLENIQLLLADDSRAGITINGICLTNVNSSISFDGEKAASPEYWINKTGYQKSEADRLTFESMGTFIPNGGSHNVWHTFYAYPNGTTADSHSTENYCARYTRLVLDTDFGFYHLDIPGILGNNSYVFKSVTITSEGASSPESNDEKGRCEAILSIETWEEGGSRIERI
ncbi:MAG: fimbrial protein [Bacteroidia bacterium]|nr:fimbrial protein [Bacteroidia bacterium]